MDLSKLSTDDLEALRAGNLSAVSTEGLRALRGTSAGKQVPADAAERFAGSKPGRFLLGAGQLLSGPFQLGANVGDFAARQMGLDPTVGKAVNEWQQRLEEMKQRGMAARGTEGIDLAGLAGTVATGAGVVGKLKPAATVLGKVAQGTGIGTGFGAATPVTDGGEDFAKQKAKQTAGGAVVGGTITPALAIGGRIAAGVRDIFELGLPGGAGRIATRYQKVITGGKEHIDAVVARLRNAPEHVRGSKPTASQALAGEPAGSPLIAHERITAGTPGGPSAQFGQRIADQQIARQAARAALKETEAPLRQAALEAANRGGGIKMAPLAEKAEQKVLSVPGAGASDVVKKALSSFRERLASNTDESGVIEANNLYTIRKEIGNTIRAHAKETANWDKRLAAGLERDFQLAIDDAIEAAGGTGWKEYLKVAATGRKAISDDLARAKAAKKPDQRTTLAGGRDVGEEMRPHFPQLLMREAMIANAILRRFGRGIEPEVDAIVSQRYLNPDVLADALSKAPRGKVANELFRKYGRAGYIGGPATIQAEE